MVLERVLSLGKAAFSRKGFAGLAVAVTVSAGLAGFDVRASELPPTSDVTVTMAIDENPGDEAYESALFLRDFLASVFSITADDGLNEDQRMAQFRSLVADGLAIDYIGLQMLGRYRETVSETDLNSYREVFPDYITSLYAAQLSQLSRVNMRITRARDFGANRGVLVRSELQRKSGAPINIDWHIAKNSKELRRIIDIKVEGVSIMLTKQDEFGALIADQGLPALVAELRSRTQTGNLKVL